MFYKVTVKVEGKGDWSTTVEAPREGLAKTRVMFDYPHQLRGELVIYEVEETT